MDSDKIISNIFSNLNAESYFDCWHTHSDWNGDGNRNWFVRKEHLNNLVHIYNELKIRLAEFCKDYQLFIMIDEFDSSQDAVYVHTKNPNADNFPLFPENDKSLKIIDENLQDFVNSLNMQKVSEKVSDGTLHYLFDKTVGLSLEKK